MLALLLLLLDAPSPSAALVPTHDLAALTEAQARALTGRRARYLVQLDSPETDLDGCRIFSCHSTLQHIEAGVQFVPFEQIGDNEVRVLVEAELRVRRFGAWHGVSAFTQFELFDAVTVKLR
jgi:hypothetical protein